MPLIILALLLLFSLTNTAEKFTQLYNLNLGDPIQKTIEQFGEPSKIIPIDDHSTVYVFMKETHYIAVTESPPGSNIIYSIQVTGKNQPETTKFNGIGLGVNIDDVIKRLGKPSLQNDAIDQATQKNIPNTTIYHFGENISFEAIDNTVSSIKIKFDTTHSSDSASDEKNFQATMEKEIKIVRDYILNEEYPEVFNDKKYRISIIDFKIFDIDLDGFNEVIVAFKPHYFQTPTLQIFRVNKEQKVTRITEGLAPGPLVKRGDYFLDSHSLGLAVDIKVKKGKENKLSIGKTAISTTKMKMAVDYKNFTHIDYRNSLPMYVDMTHIDPFDDNDNCSNLEFSMIDRIFVGYKETETKKGFIAAVIKDKAYVYTINNISEDGYIDKEIEIIPLANN